MSIGFDYDKPSRKSDRAAEPCVSRVSPSSSALLGACAALPDDAPVVEQLDTETGVTVTRLGRPIELYRETFLQDPAGRFAFLGPFETNLMGSANCSCGSRCRSSRPRGRRYPSIEVNGTPLTLGAPGRSADFAGVHKSPYKIPTPWSAMYYFKVDADLVARLGEATKLDDPRAGDRQERQREDPLCHRDRRRTRASRTSLPAKWGHSPFPSKWGRTLETVERSSPVQAPWLVKTIERSLSRASSLIQPAGKRGRGSMTSALQRACTHRHERAGRVLQFARHGAASPFHSDSSPTFNSLAKTSRVCGGPKVSRCRPTEAPGESEPRLLCGCDR